jgi:hypothetical protein
MWVAQYTGAVLPDPSLVAAPRPQCIRPATPYGFFEKSPMKSINFSRCCAVVKAQDSTQCHRSFDGRSSVGQPLIGINARIANALVRSSAVIPIGVDLAGVVQTTVTDEVHLSQAFGLERTTEAFDVRIAIGCAGWDAHDREASRSASKSPRLATRSRREGGRSLARLDGWRTATWRNILIFCDI